MFDIILLVAIVAALIIKRRTTWPDKAVIAGLLLVVIVHIFTGLPRWQLIPLYLGIGVTIVVVLQSAPKRIVLQSSVIAVLSSITLVLLWVFPVYPMPEPGGDYLIGTQSFVLDDVDRDEPYNSEAEYRRFKVQLWYPSESIDGYEQARWIEDGVEVKRALTTDWGLPAFILDHIATYPSSSYRNAPISLNQSSYPVVVISHGWSSLRTLHTDFAEELASQGYIVIGIEHTYGSLATRFSETDIEYLNREALPRRAETPNYLEFANKLVETYAADIIFSLDFITELNEENGFFQGKFNLEDISALGHSTGGGAAVKAAMDDERIDRVIGYDAWVEPILQEELDEGLDIPVLYIRSEAWQTGENNGYLIPLIEKSSQSTLYQIQGTTHYDFSMVYMFSPLTPFLGATGSLDGEYLNQMLETKMLQFLSNPDPNQFISSPWEELQFILN